MILADTSVWADHLRRSDAAFTDLLMRGDIVMHPFVVGEIALGFLHRRADWLARFSEMPTLHVADPEEVLVLIERQKLIAVGIGYVDAHLLATTLMTATCRLWSRDKRLARIAARLGIGFDPLH